MVKLKNLTRRIRSFNLEHPTFKNAPGVNGAGRPESLTMLPRQVLEVHPDTLACVEIRAALNPHGKRRPTLRVIA